MTRFNKRTDHNQAAIVADLRDAHRQVHLTSAFGNDFPDLLVGHNGKWFLLEIKQEAGGVLDRGQLRFFANAKGSTAIAVNSEEALNPAFITGVQQMKLHQWLVKNSGQETLSVKRYRAVIG